MSSSPRHVHRLGRSRQPSVQAIQKYVAWRKIILMRKLAYLVGLFVLASLPAVAQESRTKDLSLEYSYLRANPSTTGFPSFGANGGSDSFALNARRSYRSARAVAAFDFDDNDG